MWYSKELLSDNGMANGIPMLRLLPRSFLFLGGHNMVNYIFLWHVFSCHLDGLAGIPAGYANWVCRAYTDAGDICAGGFVSNWAKYDKYLWYIWNYKCYINNPGYLFSK